MEGQFDLTEALLKAKEGTLPILEQETAVADLLHAPNLLDNKLNCTLAGRNGGGLMR